MTEEDIRKLSEECALYYQGRPSHKGYELSNRLTIEGYAKMALKWLSEKFCIVEKEKIKALYSKMELDGNHVDSDNDWAIYEAMDELEKIFGSELFNDTEK